MEHSLFWLRLLPYLLVGGSCPCSIDAFVLSLSSSSSSPGNYQYDKQSPKRRTLHHRYVLSAAVVDEEAASELLLWEAIKEKESRPVLNLSRRDTSSSCNNAMSLLGSPSESHNHNASNDTDHSSMNNSCWNQGQIWSETEKGLQALGFDIVVDGPKLLKACPQLYRLETAMVLKTAVWCIDTGFDIDYILQEPRILSYECTDVAYGLEFITTMLMLKDHASLQLGVIVPPLLLSGIDGGLQERAVQKALGDASDATYSANQRMAGDAAATLAQLKQKRNNRL